MSGLARGEENQHSKVNWFIVVNGTPTDAYEVGFRIFDIVGGLPGTQIFPVTPGDYENVTNAPGKFSVGSYYAYDNVNAQGWTPSLTESIGTHRIEWRWKIASGAPYQSGYEDFEVLVQSAGGSVDTYISIDDVRNEGILIADFSDDMVLAYIETWQAFLDRACRQWFNPRTLTIEFDGNNSDTIHFGIPIIEIEYLQINESGTNLDETYYKVYNDRAGFVDRKNPKISLVNRYNIRDIFSSPIVGERLVFRKGRKNQIVKGTFGYTESDGSVPKLIKRALTKLVIEKLTQPIYPEGNEVVPTPPILGTILSEKTDDHSIKYSEAGGETNPIAYGLKGITKDPEILAIIKLFKAPIGVATTSFYDYR